MSQPRCFDFLTIVAPTRRRIWVRTWQHKLTGSLWFKGIISQTKSKLSKTTNFKWFQCLVVASPYPWLIRCTPCWWKSKQLENVVFCLTSSHSSWKTSCDQTHCSIRTLTIASRRYQSTNLLHLLSLSRAQVQLSRSICYPCLCCLSTHFS